MNDTLWDLALDQWPMTLFMPAVLVLITSLTIITRFVDRE